MFTLKKKNNNKKKNIHCLKSMANDNVLFS